MIEKMTFVNITGLKDDLDRVIETYISKYDIQIENALVELKNIKGLLPYTEVNPHKDSYNLALELNKSLNIFDTSKLNNTIDREISIEEADDIVNRINDDISSLLSEKDNLQKSKDNAAEKLSKVKQFIGLNYDLDSILHFEHIRFRFGRIEKEYYEKFMSYVYDDICSIFYKGQEIDGYIWGVYFVPNSMHEKVDAIYSSMHFERFYLPEGYKGTPTQACNLLEDKMEHIDNAIKNIDERINALISDRTNDFISAFNKLETFNAHFDIRKLAALTNNTLKPFYILCGWMTKKDAMKFSDEISNDPNTYCIIEKEHSNIFSKPPIKLNNFKLFKPFEMFVEMYGLPDYKEFDPTPVIAILYSVLFGFMFGDVGQGLVLTVLGSLFAYSKKSRLGAIIARCGIFSTIFGFLFGSIFGFEDIIPALWLHPAKAVMNLPIVGKLNTVFIFTVALGSFIILMTMFFNIFNRLKLKEKGEALFDTNGVAGLVFYSSAMLSVFLIMTGKKLPATIVLVVMFVLPLLIIFFKEPLTHIIEKKASIMPKDKGMFFVQGFFEMVEVLLGYFSNTLSFVRVGAFAVSHAAMMEVVLMLGGAHSGNPNWIAIILGNIFVMGMEGLIVGIQVLRLQYYELFSRFYIGGGRAFTPYGKEKF